MFATKNQRVSTTSDTSTVISSDEEEEEFASRDSFSKSSLDNASNPWIKRINCVGSGSTEKHENNLIHETSLRQERPPRSMCSNLNNSSSLMSATNIYELNQSAGNNFSDSDYFRNDKYKPPNPLVLSGAAKYTVSAHRVKFNN